MRKLIDRLCAPSSRRVLAGIADQGLVAITSAGLLFVAVTVLSRHAAAHLLYVAQIIVFLQGVGRAFIGDVLLTYASRLDDGPHRHQQFANAHATAIILAIIGMIAVLATVIAAPEIIPSEVLWAVPFIPAIMLQDLARYTYQTRRQQTHALLIDLIWVLTEIAGIIVVLLTGHAAGGPILACWGLGATVAAGVFYLRTKINPLRGRPINWVKDTRHLLGWYTATGLLAQSTTLLIGTLVQTLLTKSAYAGFRLLQMLILQPAQSLAMALNGLLVPRASRLAHIRDIAGLHRQTRTVTTIVTAVGVTIVIAAFVLAHPVLRVYRDGLYLNVAPIAVPIAIQSLAYLAQVPLTVAIRGMQHGRSVFAQYLIFAITSLTGLLIGAWRWDMRGAAWGLCIGAAIGLIVQTRLYLSAARRLVNSDVGPSHPAPVTPVSERSPV